METPLLDFANSDKAKATPTRWGVVKASPPEFPGPAYEAKYDEVRLKGARARVYNLMKDGQWRTLREITSQTNSPEASASAHLRTLRKLLGRNSVSKRRRGNPSEGVWEYSLVVKKGVGDAEKDFPE